MSKFKIGVKRRHQIGRILGFIVALVLSLVLLIPFGWMILCSLQPDSFSIFLPEPTFPDRLHFENYLTAIREIEMVKLFINTMILVIANMVFSIVSSVLVAYGFARFKVRGSNVIFFILLSTMMLPWVVILVPQYIIFNELGWVGTRLPLILPSLGGNAFFIFLLRQYIMGIPKSLDEAAEIDGCSKLGILFKIILPQCKPILATLVVFSFVGTWSDYVGPRIYLAGSPELQTLSIGLQYFQSTNSVMPWHLVMAASVLFAIPMIIVLYSAQGAFTRGIVTTGVKE